MDSGRGLRPLAERGRTRMRRKQADRAVLTVAGEQYEFELACAYDSAILEELSFVRREAQAEADFAYEGWRSRPCVDAYAVYRAAQDRADGAQDDLAHCVRRHTHSS